MSDAENGCHTSQYGRYTDDIRDGCIYSCKWRASVDKTPNCMTFSHQFAYYIHNGMSYVSHCSLLRKTGVV